MTSGGHTRTVCTYPYTVEPLLIDIPHKGHKTFDLSVKDKFCGNTILPLKEDNISITVKLCQKLLVPKCPLFRGSSIIVIQETRRMPTTCGQCALGSINHRTNCANDRCRLYNNSYQLFSIIKPGVAGARLVF